ncbi:saccharopine dehydrogenase family protein [Calothrix sp. 336/3]|uniref:saccharopine dehydrogenase family protein n=1 Tax=Calothrix sp. 336/3 TaxID=1337936 RepID=UPI0004E2CA17|nr:saccharopine dehydrogenase NADP-binding domain-containing protein [Calothrix sp. 336/3]AKG23757.1 saccharopine dehydrogenase [Calothrix sp. 336/3]
MTKKVLILGGRGRIGYSVALDIAKYTQAEITITGRTSRENYQDVALQYLTLDLAETEKLREIIPEYNLVVHCAGPFHLRDTQVLELCIDNGVNYIDISDHRSYTIKALKLNEKALNAGIIAVVNTGIFPGISNSMVRQCIEKLDIAEKIHLSYVVAGSGGAGITVMRTTFLGLQHPFDAWINGAWQQVKPYTARENINFPAPYGQSGVYWYDMPEAFTLPQAFPTVKTVITKFGSIPDFYNHLTWIAAHLFPKFWIQSSYGIEFLSQVSHLMTDVTDRLTGVGVAVRVEVSGIKDEQTSVATSNLFHENTAVAAGCGTGSIAQLILEDKLTQPGVLTVEEALSNHLFEQVMAQREIVIMPTN